MIDPASRGAVYYYHFDGLGSIAGLSSASGGLVERYSYDVFGKPDTTSSVGNPYLFTGRRYDTETGLYYYRARYYNPQIGRFMQPDPIGYFAGLNLYTYCENGPTIWIDPLGLMRWGQFFKGVGEAVSGVASFISGCIIAGGSSGLAAPAGYALVVYGNVSFGAGITNMVGALANEDPIPTTLPGIVTYAFSGPEAAGTADALTTLAPGSIGCSSPLNDTLTVVSAYSSYTQSHSSSYASPDGNTLPSLNLNLNVIPYWDGSPKKSCPGCN